MLYIYDERDPSKQLNARSLFVKNTEKDLLVISTQVIQEFCNVILNKIKSTNEAGLIKVVSEVLAPLLGHTPDKGFYLNALDLHASASISFYDSLIVQAAIDLDCSTLYSEDLQHGQKFGKLQVINPFKEN